MFDVLKDLSPGDAFTIDDPKVFDFTQSEDFEVVEKKLYTGDEGDLLIIDTDGYYLVAHTLAGDPRYYIYEMNLSGTISELEDDGVSVLNDDGEFRERFSIKGQKPTPLTAVIGPIYGLNLEDTEVECTEAACCEYRAKSKHYPVTLFEKCDTHFNVYQGFRISENSIVI